MRLILPPILTLFALAACKPPPTDADMARDGPQAEPSFASAPLASPETEDAVWARSPSNAARLIYGNPGEPALLALECGESAGGLPTLQITRHSPADEGAGALLALVGNGHMGRIPVDARKVGKNIVWQGDAAAADTLWEPLAGPRALGVTVPGAGRVEVNASTAPMRFVEECREIPPAIPDPEPVPMVEPKPPTIISPPIRDPDPPLQTPKVELPEVEVPEIG